MRLGKLRLHYGSILTGYALSLVLPMVAAAMREKYGPSDLIFPFIFFYPVTLAVAFLWGPGPGALSLLFSAFSVPLFLRSAHPIAPNWASLITVGFVCIGIGSGLRALRESSADAARADLRFRLVTENIRDWVFFLDEAGRIDYANRAACTGLGRDLNDLARRRLTDIVAHPEQHNFSELLRTARLTPPAPRESVLVSSSGEAVPVEVGCTAISAPHGIMIHVACRDLRERRDTERTLRDARHWESLGTLAGGLAHDFNNLLTAMMGNASLAREMLPPSHESAGLLDSVIEAGARSATLIEMMLAAAGYRRTFLQRLDLRPLLESAIAKLTVPEHVQISMECDSGSYFGEHSSLERLLLCLLENAIEAYGSESSGSELCRAGGCIIRVEVGLAKRKSSEAADFEEGDCGEAECLHIVVEDRGVGMDMATLERAFDPFFTTKFMGRGLGLAAVRGLVRAYSGKLWIRSRPDEGTRVEIWLPHQNI